MVMREKKIHITNHVKLHHWFLDKYAAPALRAKTSIGFGLFSSYCESMKLFQKVSQPFAFRTSCFLEIQVKKKEFMCQGAGYSKSRDSWATMLYR
jgi:hypothetical protein